MTTHPENDTAVTDEPHTTKKPVKKKVTAKKAAKKVAKKAVSKKETKPLNHTAIYEDIKKICRPNFVQGVPLLKRIAELRDPKKASPEMMCIENRNEPRFVLIKRFTTHKKFSGSRAGRVEGLLPLAWGWTADMPPGMGRYPGSRGHAKAAKRFTSETPVRPTSELSTPDELAAWLDANITTFEDALNDGLMPVNLSLLLKEYKNKGDIQLFSGMSWWNGSEQKIEITKELQNKLTVFQGTPLADTFGRSWRLGIIPKGHNVTVNPFVCVMQYTGRDYNGAGYDVEILTGRNPMGTSLYWDSTDETSTTAKSLTRSIQRRDRAIGVTQQAFEGVYKNEKFHDADNSLAILH